MVDGKLNDVLIFLDERNDEFARHLSVARMLAARVDAPLGKEDVHIGVGDVNHIKSGLLIHLYNIVEAVTTRTLEVVGKTIAAESPGGWTKSVLTEWVRAEVWNRGFERLVQACGAIALGNRIEAFEVKGASGNWNDEAIKKVAKRLGCKLVLPAKVRKAAYAPDYKDESTALAYLARKRNAIAHGESTFENGANDLTLDELECLANRVLPFLRAVSESYEVFLEKRLYLTEKHANS